MKFNIEGAQTGRIPLPSDNCTWSPYGLGVPTFVYTKPVYPDRPSWAHHRLGTIKLRTDGRWSWWRRPSPHPSIVWNLGEGVSTTKMGAVYSVQEGWISHALLRLQPIDPESIASVYEYAQDVRHDPFRWEMRVVLGRVIDTHTKVFTWQRSKSKYHPNWKPGCGRASSIKEASMKLMEGWQ